MNLYQLHSKPKTLFGYSDKAKWARTANGAYQYVWYILGKKRFPEGEAALATDPKLATSYAILTKRRFPAAEANIAKSTPSVASLYASKVLGGRFQEAESMIAKDPESALQYAMYCVKGRWEAGEAAISKDASCSVLYAEEVLWAPFPAGEAAIAKDGVSAVQYAVAVLKDVFPAGELAIAKTKGPDGYERYVEEILDNRVDPKKWASETIAKAKADRKKT